MEAGNDPMVVSWYFDKFPRRTEVEGREKILKYTPTKKQTNKNNKKHSNKWHELNLFVSQCKNTQTFLYTYFLLLKNYLLLNN